MNASVNEISECSEVCLLKLQASITNKIDVKNLDGPDCPSSNNLQTLIQMVQSYPIQFILLTDEWMNGGKLLPVCLLYRSINLLLYRFIALSIYPIGKLSKSKSKSNPIQMSNKWIEDQFIALQMFSFSNTWSKNIFLGASKSRPTKSAKLQRVTVSRIAPALFKLFRLHLIISLLITHANWIVFP